MKHESSVMDDLFRARLVNIIAMKHLLVRLLEALGTSAQAVWSKGRVHHQLLSPDSASFNPTISLPLSTEDTMTDITTTSPIAIGSIRTTRSRNPLLVIGQGIGRLMKACSRGLRGLLVAYVRAIELAYLEPYRIHSRKEQAAPDADFEGRDPSWWLP